MLVLGGCAFVKAPVNGFIYTELERPVAATSVAKSTRTGRSCAESYLGWVALGDASIDAAKRAGQIQEVSSVDHESFSVLGIYARFCTIVRGT
ncbi:MAG TPA: TRL-like family protein [Candidatus Eisenbacteria bacterium]|nr:TRL-like family protein [Candidatus Eisenbacteria bacterium]